MRTVKDFFKFMESDPGENGVDFEICVQSPNWTALNLDLKRFCSNVADACFFIVIPNSACYIEISLLLANDTKLRSLNRKFRNKDKPTNVLAFPMFSDRYAINQNIDSKTKVFLGDIAISYEKVLEESLIIGRSFLKHFATLLIHGILHLFGYDHIKEKDAIIMEELEAKVIEKLKID